MAGAELQGVLFDLDGVLIDSHVQHEGAWESWAREMGRKLPDGFFKKSFGKRNEEIIPHMLGWAKDPREVARMSWRKEEIYRELVARDGLHPLPGVRRLLDELRGAGLPCAVASSTPRENLDAVMRLTGLGGFFAAVLTGSDVTAGKPDPEVFLKAAEGLGVPPASSVVVEDAHAGIEAGLAAGCRVLAVATTHPAQTLGRAHRVVASLDGVGLDDLAALWRG